MADTGFDEKLDRDIEDAVESRKRLETEIPEPTAEDLDAQRWEKVYNSPSPGSVRGGSSDQADDKSASLTQELTHKRNLEILNQQERRITLEAKTKVETSESLKIKIGQPLQSQPAREEGYEEREKPEDQKEEPDKEEGEDENEESENKNEEEGEPEEPDLEGAEEGLDEGAAEGAGEAAAEAGAEAGAGVAAEAGTAAAAEAGGGFLAFLAATWEIWVPALAIILGIIFLLFIVIAVPVSICNSNYTDSLGTGVAKLGLTATGICQQLTINQNVQTATQNAPTTPTAQPAGNDAADRTLLAQYGITVNKADCTTSTQTTCTSLDNTKSVVINEIISIAQACDESLGGDGTTNKCGVQVTGGSEAGHDSGVCSHPDGDKVDVSASSALTTYIQNNLTSVGGRGGAGGGAQYSDPSITSSFVLESAPAHWDISVGCIG